MTGNMNEAKNRSNNNAQSAGPAAVDWDEAVELAGGNSGLAHDLFRMLLQELPERREEINAALAANDRDRLRNRVHTLHGSTAYCGVPALRASSERLESAILHRDDDGLSIYLKQVMEDIDALLRIGVEDKK
jgi:HPt (histidine-containing phosphotransfer) domain-containing protein